MSSRILTLARHDARMQLRYGIYAAYAFVIGFYVVTLIYLAPLMPDWLPGLVIATDPSVVGFFFLGALMMLEKAENTNLALSTSPVSAFEYLAAKTVTLSTMAIIAVSVMVPFLHKDANLLILIPTVAFVSVQFIGIGVPIARLFRSVTSYLMGAAGILTPILLPAAIALMQPMPLWAILFPPASEFRLILVATGAASASTIEVIAMLSVALISAIACQYWAWRILKQDLGK